MKRNWKKALWLALGGFLIWRLVVGVRIFRELEKEGQFRAFNGISWDYVMSVSQASSLPGPLGTEFEFGSEDSFVMRSSTGVLQVESKRGDVFYGEMNKNGPPIGSFAADRLTLLAISGDKFGEVPQTEKFRPLAVLPKQGLKLATSNVKGTCLVVDPEDRKVFRMSKSLHLELLADTPKPIVAVADSKKALYVAMDRVIARFDGKGEPKIVIRLPESDGPILSIAVDPEERILYYATRTEVFALRGLGAFAVVRDLGGYIRLFEGKLYVWDPARKLLVKLDDLEKALLN